ncbi:hypothetical protein G9A89_023125 [Geosiphon pyriformis]|nr:hypothetical protein G9A89_023125 [Geosiphon pyriformis]
MGQTATKPDKLNILLRDINERLIKLKEKKLLLWDKFLEEVNQFRFDQQPRFERPQFSEDRVMTNEEDVRDALNSNICFKPHTPGIPDLNCHLGELLILVIEVKRKHVLEDIDGRTFPEFYQDNDKAKTVVQQIYDYMGANEPHNTLDLKNSSTTIKISATKDNPESLNPYQVPVPTHGNNNPCVLRSHTSTYQQLPNASDKLHNFAFTDFKFMDILDEGRSAPPYVLEEMQKEVEIYESLADIQGQYIPKLVCHGYFGGGMCFIIELTIVGTPLDKHKITKQQSSRALKALEAIHKHGISISFITTGKHKFDINSTSIVCLNLQKD